MDVPERNQYFMDYHKEGVDMIKRLFYMAAALAAAISLMGCQANLNGTVMARLPLQTEPQAGVHSVANVQAALPDMEKLPQIKVTWGDKEKVIPSAAGSIQWVVQEEKEGEAQGITASGRDPFNYLARVKSEWPYLPIESWITIKFLNTPAPESITVSDLILGEDGAPKYGEDTVKTKKIYPEEQTVSFSLDTNFWAMLSAERKTYQTGGVIRGFRLDCTWENGSRADYGFIVRSDVACGVKDRSAEVCPMSLCGTGVPIAAGIDNIDVDENGLTLTVTLDNRTDQKYLFGEEPKLYRYYGPDAKAVSLRPGAGWNDAAHILRPNRKTTFAVNLGELYGPLKPGYYVFYKELTNSGTEEKETVSVIFTVAD